MIPTLVTSSKVVTYFYMDSVRLGVVQSGNGKVELLEIIFEDETWTVDLINNKIEGRDKSIIFEIPEFSIINTYHDQMRYFIDHIRLKKNTMNSIEEAYEVLKICLKNE